MRADGQGKQALDARAQGGLPGCPDHAQKALRHLMYHGQPQVVQSPHARLGSETQLNWWQQDGQELQPELLQS